MVNDNDNNIYTHIIFTHQCEKEEFLCKDNPWRTTILYAQMHSYSCIIHYSFISVCSFCDPWQTQWPHTRQKFGAFSITFVKERHVIRLVGTFINIQRRLNRCRSELWHFQPLHSYCCLDCKWSWSGLNANTTWIGHYTCWQLLKRVQLSPSGEVEKHCGVIDTLSGLREKVQPQPMLL